MTPKDGLCSSDPFEGSATGDFYRDFCNDLDDKLRQGISPSILDSPCTAGPPKPLRLQRFSNDSLPPSTPDSKDFKLEPTTLHVSGADAADVGNHLLDFLGTVAGASVTKVDSKKFSIKANVDGDQGTCTVKVRIFARDPGKYAVEFQRRGGDSMALHLVFERAQEYLEHLVRAMAPQPSKPSTPPTGNRAQQSQGIIEVELSPLRDWADPGVRGLLRRSRRRSQSSPVLTTEAPQVEDKDRAPFARTGSRGRGLTGAPRSSEPGTVQLGPRPLVRAS